MQKIRVAIWAAVSSVAQAKEDKVSLNVQLELARRTIQQRGWVETAGPYIAVASRTTWVNLKDAAAAIPDLALLLTEAQARLYDLLIIYDYTRLRVLLNPLSKTLSAYSIQILSLTQPVEIIDPEKYDPANADTSSIIEFAAGFTSQAEIASLKRRYRIGMPKRITEKGLHKGLLPFGYRKPIGHETDRQVTPEQNPTQVATILLIKDLFLSGKSTTQIAAYLTEKEYISSKGKKKWHNIMVRQILKNKYYSGQVSFGKLRGMRDPITNSLKFIKNPPSSVYIGIGRHIPLWDAATAKLIDQEFENRASQSNYRYTGKQTTRLSNILYCGVCEARIWSENVGYAPKKKRYYFCSNSNSHFKIKEEVLVPRFMDELKERFKHTDQLFTIKKQSLPENNAASLKQLEARRSRIIDAYEAGAIPLQEYITRTADLTAQIDRAQKEIIDNTINTERIKQKSEAINSFAQLIKLAPGYLTEAPAQQVNTHLRRIIKKAIVTPTEIKIEFS